MFVTTVYYNFIYMLSCAFVVTQNICELLRVLGLKFICYEIQND